MRAGDRNRKFIPDRNADPVLHPSLLSGSPGGLRSTVFLKTLSGTIPHSSQMLLPSDEGRSGQTGAVDLDDCDIGLGIGSHHFAFKRTLVGTRYGNLRGLGDHVIVG